MSRRIGPDPDARTSPWSLLIAAAVVVMLTAGLVMFVGMRPSLWTPVVTPLPTPYPSGWTMPVPPGRPELSGGSR